jgi:hypothetical protein
MIENKLPSLKKFELLLFVSPETRCVQGLGAIRHLPAPKRAWVIDFRDYEEPQARDASQGDIQAAKAYKRNRNTIKRWLAQNSVEEKVVSCHLGQLEPFDTHFGPINAFRLPLLVDISCAPRGRLFALLDYLSRCQTMENQRVCLMYTLVKRHATDEDAYSYGIQDIVVVPGFNGVIRLRKDLLILVLGFEGNRAFSLYKRLSPNKAFLILGDSSDKDREFYLKHSEVNNGSLLRIHGIEKRLMPSRDPITFARAFQDFLNETIEPIHEQYNVYVSCLGTKLQALGLYWAIRGTPYIQLLDSIPSRRRIATMGRRETVFLDLGSSGLREEPRA